MDDAQFNILIDALNDIAENLRRIAYEIEKKKETENESIQ